MEDGLSASRLVHGERSGDLPDVWLVTGVAGFIGSHLLETLLTADRHVVGLDNFSTGKKENLADVEARVGPEKWARFRLIEGDLRSRRDCDAAVHGVDVVLHEAALNSVPRSMAQPAQVLETNSIGSVNLFSAAVDAGVSHVVYASSSSVYGDVSSQARREPVVGEPTGLVAGSGDRRRRAAVECKDRIPRRWRGQATMPKKRKKDRKASRKQAPVRNTPAQHAGMQPWGDVPEEDINPLRDLADRFPTPADGAKAVRVGERVEWTGEIDGSMMRHRVLLADDGTAVVEQAVFVGGALEKILLCAWHQAGEQGRDSLEAGVLAALDDLHAAVRPVVEAEIREARPNYTAPTLQSFREKPEQHGPGMPAFGWRILHQVDQDTTWEVTIDAATWNSSQTMSGWLGYYDHVPELQPAGLARLLHQHGVPAVLCARCGNPITDRHPRWTGIWITPDSESGPLCGAPHTGLVSPEPLLGTLTDQDFGDPHRPG
ncbi:NAD-dependent epimerase/dehydratase family protein [Streptomyces platensis]|uniref:NAD-dependent epimerase/dehydratase family protein n=1 Tax=Streptomyces platensis TaxID=58346 RepID=UPI003C2EAF6A